LKAVYGVVMNACMHIYGQFSYWHWSAVIKGVSGVWQWIKKALVQLLIFPG